MDDVNAILYFRKTVHCVAGLGDELRSGASPGTLSKAKACQNSEGVAAMHIHTCAHSRTLISSFSHSRSLPSRLICICYK